MDTDISVERAVCFTLQWEAGRLIQAATNSLEINRFLDYIKMTRAYYSWVNHAHDLKLFFATVNRRPPAITREDCINFMQQQDMAGLASATINRRLAAFSSLFQELHLLDPEHYPQNPVHPRQRVSSRSRRSLYRKQSQRLPQIIPSGEHHFVCIIHLGTLSFNNQ